MTTTETPEFEPEALGLRAAPVGRRVAASAIDGALLLAAASPAVLAAVPLVRSLATEGPSAVGAGIADALLWLIVGTAMSAAVALAQIVAHGVRGRTLGRWVLGLRAVRADGWGAPGFGRALLRALVLGLAALVVPVLGPAVLLASPLWDRERRRRGILDRIAREWAIDVRRALDPTDKEAMRAARRALREAPRRRVAESRPLHSGGGAALQVPTDRSSAGVVSAGAGAEWAPPVVLAPTPPAKRPEPAAPREPARLVLRFDDGTSIHLADRVLIGRAPTAGPGEPSAQLVALADPSMQLSKTHALIAHDGRGGATVVDRDSRNGVRVSTPSGALEPITPREAVELAIGQTVELGGRRVTLETESA